MFEKLHAFNWNKAHLEDGKVYRKVSERRVKVYENQKQAYMNTIIISHMMAYGIMLILIAIYYISAPFALTSADIIIGWLVAFLLFECFLIPFLVLTFFLLGLADRTFKIYHTERKSRKTYFEEIPGE